MRKILLLTFVLFPSLAQAIECESPQICTLKASEVCTQHNLKLFGDDECIECGCPDGGEVKEQICCKNGYAWDEKAKSYSESEEACGCPNGQEKDDEGACCAKDKMLVDGGKKCCNEDEEVAAGVCCKKNKVITEPDGTKLCCLDDEEILKGSCCLKTDIVWLNGDEQVCGCPDGQHASEFKQNDKEIKRCCPNGKNALDGSGDCCTDDKKYLATDNKKIYFNDEYEFLTGKYLHPRDNYYLCCDGDIYDYKTYVDGKGLTDIKQCCNNGYTGWCPSGVVVSLNQQCSCGCNNNFDCNQNIFGLPRKTNIIHRCQADHTCEDALSFDISGIKVEIQDFEGGKITRNKVERMVQKIRQDLLASTGNDQVKIIFSGNLADNDLEYQNKGGTWFVSNGYSVNGDKLVIYINSGACKEMEGEFQCSATIVHENVHRVDNINQPMWQKGNKPVTQKYQSCLTEIHAQARGALTAVRNVFENCYRYQNAQAYPTCGPSLAFDKLACEKCMAAVKVQEIAVYAGKYYSSGYAQKYYSDPKWTQDENCNGLVAQLEEDFANSDYAERSYFGKKRAELRESMGHLSFDVLSKISTFRKASEQDQGLFGLASRTGFLWNKYPSPSSVEGIARLYAQNATLCMSPSRFANHPAIQLGANNENINDLEEAYAFIKVNPDCSDAGYLTNACQEKLQCVTDQWRNGCWPAAEWRSYVDDIETYSID